MNGANGPRPDHRVPLETMRRFDLKRLWALVLKESVFHVADLKNERQMSNAQLRLLLRAPFPE